MSNISKSSTGDLALQAKIQETNNIFISFETGFNPFIFHNSNVEIKEVEAVKCGKTVQIRAVLNIKEKLSANTYLCQIDAKPAIFFDFIAISSEGEHIRLYVNANGYVESRSALSPTSIIISFVYISK